MSPSPSRLSLPLELSSPEGASGTSSDASFRLLVEALRDAAARARRRGATLAEFLEALESTIALRDMETSPAIRAQLRTALHHWGRLAYLDVLDAAG